MARESDAVKAIVGDVSIQEARLYSPVAIR
jgi:hypothetical protein